MKTTHYEVRFSTIIDHPELRDASYPSVPVGHVVHTTLRLVHQGAAINEFNEVLEGRDDFGSEYVYKITVLAMRDGRSPRVVRSLVERTRAAVRKVS